MPKGRNRILIDFNELISTLEAEDCGCGRSHSAVTRRIYAESGMISRVGEAMRDISFPHRVLVVTDRDSMPFALLAGKNMAGYEVSLTVLDGAECASEKEVRAIVSELEKMPSVGLLAICDGASADVCRIAAHEKNVPLCVFPLCPIGFGFMTEYADMEKDGVIGRTAAKAPCAVLADTDVLSAFPMEKKALTLGALASVYPMLIDARTAAVMKNEVFCDKAEAMLRYAADSAFEYAYAFSADAEQSEAEEASSAVFDSLICAGLVLQMLSFDASEQSVSGFERYLLNHGASGKNIHVSSLCGTCALRMLGFYRDLLILYAVKGQTESEKASGTCGEERAEPNPLAGVSHEDVEEKWDEVRNIIADMPTFDEIKGKMQTAGCATDFEELGIEEKNADEAFIAFPYTCASLTLVRLTKMIDFTKIYRSVEEIKEKETEENDGVEIDIPQPGKAPGENG